MHPRHFQNLVSVVLGLVFGMLVGLPLVASQPPPSESQRYLPLLEIFGFAAFGSFVGWRRRTSAGFYYFCVAGILILTVLNAGALKN